jgi:hypothetical protein
MTTFFKKFIGFIILALIAWLFGITLFGRLAPGYLQKNVRVTYYRNYNLNTFREIDTVSSPDILIAGSSTAFRSFDPRVFSRSGLRIFVIGSSAQSPVQTEYLVNKYIDKLKPKMFIYVANMQSFNSDGKEGWLFLINNLLSYDKTFIKGALTDKSFILYNTFAYNVVDHMLRTPKPVTSKIERYVGSGYVEYTVLAHDTIFHNNLFPKNTYTMDEKQKQAFERTVQEIKKRNIPLLVIQAPMFPPLFKTVTNPHDFDNYFLQTQGLWYINYNYADFNKDEFWDIYHLNQHGVEKLDKMAIDTLASLKLR